MVNAKIFTSLREEGYQRQRQVLYAADTGPGSDSQGFRALSEGMVEMQFQEVSRLHEHFQAKMPRLRMCQHNDM